MLDLITHKIAGEEFHIAPARQENNVIDLMAALQASIEAVQHIPSDPGPSLSGTGTGTGKKPRAAAAGKKKPAQAKASGTPAPEPEVPAVNEATGPIPVIAPKPKRRTAKSKITGA
jgi:DNA end-binding protein Ku